MRLFICVVINFLLFNLLSYAFETFILHQTWTFGILWCVIIPVIFGVVEAVNWKLKDDKE